MKTSKKDKYQWPTPHRILNSGNDVIMPGSKRDIAELKNALTNGSLTRQQLEHNISRFVRVALQLTE